MTHRTGSLHRSGVIGTALVLLAVGGCGPSRRVQCQELGQATQAVMGEVEAAYTSQIGGLAYDPNFERTLAAAWRSGVDIVEAAEVSDRTLKQFQADLAIAYQQAADIGLQIADITPSNGRPDADTEAQIEALRLQSQEKIPPVINDLNQYCIGG